MERPPKRVCAPSLLFEMLPPETIADVLSLLHISELFAVASTCKYLHKLAEAISPLFRDLCALVERSAKFFSDETVVRILNAKGVRPWASVVLAAGASEVRSFMREEHAPPTQKIADYYENRYTATVRPCTTCGADRVFECVRCRGDGWICTKCPRSYYWCCQCEIVLCARCPRSQCVACRGTVCYRCSQKRGSATTFRMRFVCNLCMYLRGGVMCIK